MIRAILREAVAAARSQPVASAVAILMVSGMILAVMLTTGRTVGAEQQVLTSIDSVGTRAITVRAEADAGVTSAVIGRLANIEGIEWAAAFSSAVDSTNSLIPEATRVPVRFAYGTDWTTLGMPPRSAIPGQLAWASPLALDQLGMPDAVGSITLVGQRSYGVVGALEVPEYLAAFEPLVLIPRPDMTGSEPVSVVLVVVAAPELVGAVSDAVTSVLSPDDPTKISVLTSETFTQLRALVQGQLGEFSRGLVLALLAVTGGLMASLMYGLVMMRRKDFGRRRALGATRGFIVLLLLMQTGILALLGIVIGIGLALVALLSTGDPLPGVGFTAALAVLTLVTALVATVLPALIASRREPIRELRVA